MTTHRGAVDLPCVRQTSPFYFSTKKLPRISASIPELKKVRMAPVGVWTMASPRRLNEVFMTTGTPVRHSDATCWRNDAWSSTRSDS